MHLWALTNVLLCVREKVVRTGACQVGAADFGICEGELSGARRRGSPHKLLEQLSLFSGHCVFVVQICCLKMLKVGGALKIQDATACGGSARRRAKFLPVSTAYCIEPSTSQLELSKLRLQVDFPRAKVRCEVLNDFLPL